MLYDQNVSHQTPFIRSRRSAPVIGFLEFADFFVVVLVVRIDVSALNVVASTEAD